MDIKLPYYVLQDEGSAKFDKKIKTLKIELKINKDKHPEEKL